MSLDSCQSAEAVMPNNARIAVKLEKQQQTSYSVRCNVRSEDPNVAFPSFTLEEIWGCEGAPGLVSNRCVGVLSCAGHMLQFSHAPGHDPRMAIDFHYGSLDHLNMKSFIRTLVLVL